MTARLWRSVLLVELGLAAGAAWLLTTAIGGQAWVMIVLWLAIFALLQPMLVALLFALGRLAARGLYDGLSLRSIAAESAAILFAALAMCRSARGTRGACGRTGAGTSGSTPDTRASRPLLLVHGVLCSGAIWRRLQRRLTEAGFSRVRIIELQPLLADIEAHASHLAREILAMQRESGEERVVIIAHSMGGLVARAALRKIGAAAVSRIITLGTPHHGTAIACHLPFAPMRQMRRGSSWLARLNAEQEGRLGVPLTSLYSLEDALIAPPRSAELAGARLIPLHGLGHVSLVTSSRALDRILDELRPERAASVRGNG